MKTIYVAVSIGMILVFSIADSGMAKEGDMNEVFFDLKKSDSGGGKKAPPEDSAGSIVLSEDFEDGVLDKTKWTPWAVSEEFTPIESESELDIPAPTANLNDPTAALWTTKSFPRTRKTGDTSYVLQAAFEYRLDTGYMFAAGGLFPDKISYPPPLFSGKTADAYFFSAFDPGNPSSGQVKLRTSDEYAPYRDVYSYNNTPPQSIRCRITLGVSAGALWEYHDGNKWIPLRNTVESGTDTATHYRFMLASWLHLNKGYTKYDNIVLGYVEPVEPHGQPAVHPAPKLPAELKQDYPAIPPIQYQGERYKATVPDTLDLAERARLAVNGLTSTLDPAQDYFQWFFIWLSKQPPVMQHCAGDFNCTPKYAQSIPLMRVMSGSMQNIDHDQKMLEYLVNEATSTEDGLHYVLYNEKRPWHSSWHGGTFGVKKEDVANVFGNGRMLLAMLVLDQLDAKYPWDRRIAAMIYGLDKIAIHKDDYAYYPPKGGFGEAGAYPRTGWLNIDEPKSDKDAPEGITSVYGHPTRGAALWAQRSGNEQALRLARELKTLMIQPQFWGGLAKHKNIEDKELGHIDFHAHARAIGLRGILEYGIAANDTYALDFVRSAYEYIRTLGISQIGWYSLAGGVVTMEGCTLGDMIALAIKLSDAGAGDYWDDVDRMVRNTMAEAQFTDPERLSAYVRRQGKHTRDDIVDRAIGHFSGVMKPNCFSQATPGPADVVACGCCTGNGTQGLYFAWDGITRCQGDNAQINLLLNRAAPWLDIDSHLPYEGKVVIRNKTARRISIRIPVWVDRGKLTCKVDGKPLELSWVGPYLVVNRLNGKSTIELNFPVAEQTIQRTACGTQYTIHMRGNTVVDISPRDTHPSTYKLYLRDHLKSGRKAPMKEVERFVSATIPQW